MKEILTLENVQVDCRDLIVLKLKHGIFVLQKDITLLEQ